MSEYNIGDRVKFVDEEEVYYRYEDMANKLTAKHWTYDYKGGKHINKRATIINSSIHECLSFGLVYLIEFEDGVQLLVSSEGIEDKAMTIEEAFEIRQLILDTTNPYSNERRVLSEVLYGSYDRFPDKISIAKDDLKFSRING